MKKRAITKSSGSGSAMLGGMLLVAVIIALGLYFRSKLFTGQEGAPVEAPQATRGSESGPGRRNIYDRNFVELAVGFRRSSIYARPLELESPEDVARKVGQVLGVEEKDLLPALKGERSFSWIGRDIALEKADRIVEKNLKGVYRFDQVYRYYPGNQVGAHVIGFLKDEQGLAGVEFYYDGILRGGGGYDQRLAAAGASKKVVEGQDGASLVLTVDIRVQEMLEQKLMALAAATGAKAAMAGLMVPDTGEIIGLANLPSYDLNRFWEFGTEERRNRFVDDVFDLAGMGRLYRAAAALDLRLTPNLDGWATVRSESGSVGQTPEPSAAVPSQTQTAPQSPQAPAQVPWNWIQNGVYVSPEGVALAQFGVDSTEFGRFAERIGLAGRGEVDLPETLFSMKEPETVLAGRSGEMDGGDGGGEPAKGSFGQQEKEPPTSATPMSMLASFCRLINGGRNITPHVLSAVWHDDQVWDVPVKQAAIPLGVRPEVSAALLDGMRKWRVAGQDFFVMESLLEKNPPLPPQAADPASVVSGGGKLQAEYAAPEGGTQRQPLVNSILLGAGSLQHPDLAVVVVLEGARINPQGASPMRGVLGELLGQARLVMAKRQGKPSPDELAKREGGYYQKWQQNQEKAALIPAVVSGAQGVVMPDVRGLSLRKSLQVLQQYGLRVRISGTGQVARQAPAPGAPLKGVDQCALELKVMQ